MTSQERLELFAYELNLIKDPGIRKLTEHHLVNAPDYFFRIPASSTGKYHPQYALGEGGLVRHTKAAVRICEKILSGDVLDWYIPDHEHPYADMIYSALIMHDTYKAGTDPDENCTTAFAHPTICARTVLDEASEIFLGENGDGPQNVMNYKRAILIARCIGSHMGKWNRSKYSPDVLPTPMTMGYDNWPCRLVHLCDLLASDRHLEYLF